MDRKKFSILILSTSLAAFLGAFFASLFVFGNLNRPVPPFFINHPPTPPGYREIPNPQAAIQEQQELFNKFNKDVDKSLKMDLNRDGFIYVNNSELKTKETPDSYVITIDLKPFGLNPKNVTIKADDKKVLILAQYQSKNKKGVSSAKFSQELSFPVDINEDKITKQKQGDFLVITIPKDLEDKD